MNNAFENREAIPPPRVVAAMRRVLNYLWWDEQADYLSLPRHERAGHIFVSLKLFHEWLMGRLMSDNEAASAAGKRLIPGGPTMSADEKALADGRLPADSQFGSCPECGGGEGPYNTGRLHWFVCRRHLVRWWVGENLFRCWRFETRADWQKNAAWLEQFREIEPDYGTGPS